MCRYPSQARLRSGGVVSRSVHRTPKTENRLASAAKETRLPHVDGCDSTGRVAGEGPARDLPVQHQRLPAVDFQPAGPFVREHNGANRSLRSDQTAGVELKMRSEA